MVSLSFPCSHLSLLLVLIMPSSLYGFSNPVWLDSEGDTEYAARDERSTYDQFIKNVDGVNI
jgi:hypothetical protein